MLNKKRYRLKQISQNKLFLSKLYDILNNEENKDIIHWNNEGTAIIIVDINKLCELILPKYYKHSNYSSFVRQLNLYGFYKSKGIIKDGDSFEHNKINKNVTKEQIIELLQQNKKTRNLQDYNNNTNNILYNSNDINNSSPSFDNNYKIDFLLNKLEESQNNIIDLKKQIEELKNINYDLANKVSIVEKKLIGHSIFLRKLFYKNKKLIRMNNQKNKIKNMKDFLKKYLYYLRIYSPYVDLKGNRTEKVNSFKIGKMNICKNKLEIYNNCHINNIICNNCEHFFDDLPFLGLKTNLDNQ